MDGKTYEALLKARDALYELSGERRSLAEMKNYPCHSLISTPEKCGRCSRQIAAWDAIDSINGLLPAVFKKGLSFDQTLNLVEKIEIRKACQEAVSPWIMDEDINKKGEACVKRVWELLQKRGIVK